VKSRKLYSEQAGRLTSVTIEEFHAPPGDGNRSALPMSALMIRCPSTGRSVSTAIETEQSVFRGLPKVVSRMLCPACGQEHVWLTSSAWLAGESRLVDERYPAGAAA
jgi:hypothetical protein